MILLVLLVIVFATVVGMIIRRNILHKAQLKKERPAHVIDDAIDSVYQLAEAVYQPNPKTKTYKQGYKIGMSNITGEVPEEPTNPHKAGSKPYINWDAGSQQAWNDATEHNDQIDKDIEHLQEEVEHGVGDSMYELMIDIDNIIFKYSLEGDVTLGNAIVKFQDECQSLIDQLVLKRYDL